MMDVNIMNGKPGGVNDPPGIGVGIPYARVEPVLKATLTELDITAEPKPDSCVIRWQACKSADRYRVDLYRIEDRGPNMHCLNYIMMQAEWTEETELETVKLLPMTSYQAIVFAYKGEEFIGRYSAVYCVVDHRTVGDMLCYDTEDYSVRTAPLSDTSVKFSALPAEKSVLLNENPDRGFRTEAIYIIPPKEELYEWTRERVIQHVFAKHRESVMNEKVTVSRVYFVLMNYAEADRLPDEVVRYMDAVYEAYEKLGVRMYLCHFYMREHVVDQPPFERVMTHLGQIKELFTKHRNILFAANFTFLGRYGEWTCIRIPFDFQKFVNEFMDAVPPEVRLITRHPRIKATYVNPEYWRYPRIGFADDACHGLAFANVDLGQSYTQPGSEWWDMDVRESPYTVNDTELFTTRWIRLSGSWPDGYSCMQSLSQKHTSTVSMEHGYSDILRFGGELCQTCFAGWKGQEVTPELLKGYGLAYSPAWFTDKYGNTVRRNVFEYLRDYTGYRFSAEELNIEAGESSLKVGLKLKNYGYTAGFNLVSGFALLDRDGNAVADIPAGDPEVWYGTRPEPYEDRELLTHTVSAKLPLPEKPGKYSLAFYMKNPMGQTARLDNAVSYENGYNILYGFSL